MNPACGAPEPRSVQAQCLGFLARPSPTSATDKQQLERSRPSSVRVTFTGCPLHWLPAQTLRPRESQSLTLDRLHPACIWLLAFSSAPSVPSAPTFHVACPFPPQQDYFLGQGLSPQPSALCPSRPREGAACMFSPEVMGNEEWIGRVVPSSADSLQFSAPFLECFQWSGAWFLA